MDSNNANEVMDRKGGLNIRLSIIFIGVLCFLMILPDDVFSWFSLYKNTTPSSIAYKWLNYDFGIIQLIIAIIGFFCAIKLKKKNLFIVSCILFFRELLYFLISDNNVFSASAYELYLIAIVGYSFVLLVEVGIRTKEDKELFFKCFLISNMLTIYIDYIMGGSGAITEGRYNASNLDVGGTGTVCVLCILFLINSDKKWYDYIFILLSIIGLFLSGSRSNLLFLVLISIAFSAMSLFSRHRKEKRQTIQRRIVLGRLTIIIVILVASIPLVSIYSESVFNWLLESRYQALLNLQSFKDDSSIVGRTASLIAGLDVLKCHPIGISGYFINLQQEMRLRGYPTFPHSTLLAMYLLYGPIILLPYYKWIKNILKLRIYERKYSQILLYFVVSSIIYGGPIMNFKVLFIYFMVTSLASQTS